MKLSIVATLYKSASYLEEFLERAQSSAKKVAGESYEIILVNDGSPDDGVQLAINIAKKDSHIVVVDLSRNFGHHKAMMCGLEFAQGERVFLIDSDLEEEPEWLINFNETLNQSSADVVYGVQKMRRGKKVERISGRLFYSLFRLLTNVAQPDNIVTARLMSRDYVQSLLLHKESEINIGGLWLITGFDQLKIEVTKHSSSETTYSLKQKLSHFINAVTSFSSVPLVAIFYIGLFISFCSALFVGQITFKYFFLARPVDGYTSMIASIWLLAGLIILFIGVQGLYLSKIFSEVKRRPNVIIKAVHGRDCIK